MVLGHILFSEPFVVERKNRLIELSNFELNAANRITPYKNKYVTTCEKHQILSIIELLSINVYYGQIALIFTLNIVQIEFQVFFRCNCSWNKQQGIQIYLSRLVVTLKLRFDYIYFASKKNKNTI